MSDAEQWKAWLIEPFQWLFCFFFQPTKFKEDFEIEGFLKLKRVIPTLKLALPTFICSYLCAVIIWLIWKILFNGLLVFTTDQLSLANIFSVSSKVFDVLLPIMGSVLQGLVLGTIVGIVVGLRYGIIVGITLGATLGIASGNGWGSGLDVVWSIAGTIIGGIAQGAFLGGMAGGGVGGGIGIFAGGIAGSLIDKSIQNTSLPAKTTDDAEYIHEIEDEDADYEFVDDDYEVVAYKVESASDTQKNHNRVIITGILVGIFAGGMAGLILGTIAGTLVGILPGGIAGMLAGGLSGSIGAEITRVEIEETIKDFTGRATEGTVGNLLNGLRDASALENYYEGKGLEKLLLSTKNIVDALVEDFRDAPWMKIAKNLGKVFIESCVGILAGGLIGLLVGSLIVFVVWILSLILTQPATLGGKGFIVLAVLLVLILALTKKVSNKIIPTTVISIVFIGAIAYLPTTLANSLGSLFSNTFSNFVSNILQIPHTGAVNVIGRFVVGIPLIGLFLIIYALCYYRLLFYPISGIASAVMYFASINSPSHVFNHIHRSPLYWDESVFLPLPGLRQMLLIAAKQDEEQTLEEINFIAHARRQQINIARAVTLEIAVWDMEARENLHDIANAAQQLDHILSSSRRLITPSLRAPFARLNDASRDTVRYYSPLSWQARQDALKNMESHLKKAYPRFRDGKLNIRMEKIVARWLVLAQQELEKLGKMLETSGKILNPYSPGQVLELRNNLFVGRLDLVQKLEEELNKGSRRPTFLLNGERRMGKSSTLKQLPFLLGGRYIPVFYDLQSPKVLSSTVSILSTIAEEIYLSVSSRGMITKQLDYTRLQDTEDMRNEAAVYNVFDEWLGNLERMLMQEDHVLLLAFDEFEKLEDARKDGYLNLRLLLDWFRTLIQYHSQIALLFSGVRSFKEMNVDWISYFVNVQTLKVSFLEESEAYQLITRPMTDFPGEEIFGEDVIQEIVRVTCCHPFLIQAICSRLIDNLNAQNRTQAYLDDVETTVEEILESWETYFQDLWNRTDHEQRACLFSLIVAYKAGSDGTVSTIKQHTSLSENVIYRTLKLLFERDLIRRDENTYHIAAPIFSRWVERSSYDNPPFTL